MYTDPSGEWIHIAIGALVGGVINTAAHWNQIDNFWDGVAAFGIGAAAGGVAAATFGAAMPAGGGFLAAANAAMYSYAASTPIMSFGNTAYFGDPAMTAQQYFTGMALSGVAAGAMQGISSMIQGGNFWRGTMPVPSGAQASSSSPLTTDKAKPKLNTGGMRATPKTMPDMYEGQTLLRIKGPDGQVRWIPKNGSGSNSVYVGIDKSGSTRYVGITKRMPEIRFGEHLNSFGTGKELLRYRVIDGATNLSRLDARIFEQTLINQYGLKNLLNIRNSITPSNWFQYGIY